MDLARRVLLLLVSALVDGRLLLLLEDVDVGSLVPFELFPLSLARAVCGPSPCRWAPGGVGLALILLRLTLGVKKKVADATVLVMLRLNLLLLILGSVLKFMRKGLAGSTVGMLVRCP